MHKALLMVAATLLLAVVAIAGLETYQSPVESGPASPADTFIAQGKFYLQTHNILAADDQFTKAVEADPANQEANFLKGVTRLFAFVEKSNAPSQEIDSIREIFELSGVTFQTFGLYSTSYTANNTLADTTPRTGALLNFIKVSILPEVDAAITNLSVVTNTNFSSVITPASINKTTGLNLSIDYADAIVVKSLLYLLKCNINILLAYNLDVDIPDISSAPLQLMTYKALFQDASLLTVKDAPRLTTARNALISFIDSYNLATPLLIARQGTSNHLFVVDAPVTNEPFDVTSLELNDVASVLADVKASLIGPRTFTSPTNPLSTQEIDLSKFFDATKPLNLRALIGDCSTGTAYPDASFGGVLPSSFPSYSKLIAKTGAHLLGVACTGREVPRITIDAPYLYLYDNSYTYMCGQFYDGTSWVYNYCSQHYSSGPQPVTITNTGTASLKISQISFAGGNASAFTVSGGTCGTTTPMLFPGQSCSVYVGLKYPTSFSGYFSSLIKIDSNDTTQPTVYNNVSANLSTPDGGTIRGAVKDAATLAGIPAVDVEVYGENSQTSWLVTTVTTDTSGVYVVSGLPQGTYKIQYTPVDTAYISKWSGTIWLGTTEYNIGDVTLTKKPPVNGTCGVANGVPVTAPPTANLCLAGTSSAVTGSGPWNWGCSGLYGGTNASCSANVKVWNVSVTIAGSGSGTVNSYPAGIHCTGSSCSAQFANGSAIDLYASESAGSLFSGWSGSCSGSGTCAINLYADSAVIATFTAGPNIMIGTKTFSSLQIAYDDLATANDSVIKLLEGIIANTLTAGRGISVKLEGGYDALYSGVSNDTTIQGPVRIRAGTVRMKGVNVR